MEEKTTNKDQWVDVAESITADVVETTGTTALANITAKEAFTEGMDYFTFMNLEDPETKLAVYSAIQNPDYKLRDWAADNPGQSIALANALIHPVKLNDEETGEVVNSWRCILFDADGNTYVAVSEGVVNSLQKLFSIVGPPDTWDKPINMIPKELKTRKGMNRVLILDIAKPAKPKTPKK